jgi:hypothetical protein
MCPPCGSDVPDLQVLLVRCKASNLNDKDSWLRFEKQIYTLFQEIGGERKAGLPSITNLPFD